MMRYDVNCNSFTASGFLAMKHCKSAASVLCITFVLTFCSGTVADEIQNGDECFDVNFAPNWNKPSALFQTWFDDCSLKISRVIQSDPAAKSIDTDISCTFMLEEDGNISDLSVYGGRGSAALNATALSIVNKAAPFNRPSELLLHKRRLLVKFSKYPKFDVLLDYFDYQNGDRDWIFQRRKLRLQSQKLEKKSDARKAQPSYYPDAMNK